MNELSRTDSSSPQERRGVDFEALSKGALIALVAGLAFAALAIGGIGIHGALHHVGFLESLQGRVTLPTLALGTSTILTIVGIATSLFSSRKEQKSVEVGSENDPIQMSEIELERESLADEGNHFDSSNTPSPIFETFGHLDANDQPVWVAADEGIHSEGSDTPSPIYEIFDRFDAEGHPLWVAADEGIHSEDSNTPSPIYEAFDDSPLPAPEAPIPQEDGDNISLPPDPHYDNFDDDPIELADPNLPNPPLFEVFDGNQWAVPGAQPMRKRRFGS